MSPAEPGPLSRLRRYASGRWPGGPLHSMHSLAVPYALDALDPDETRRFERHLATCDRCTREVRALAADTVRLARAASVPAPEDLRERILAAVRTTAQEPAGPRAAPGPLVVPRRRGTGRAPLALAASGAVLALVAAAFLALALVRTDGELSDERAAAREIAHVLAAPDARASTGRDARGRGIGVIASRAERRAVVSVTGLGRPPDGRAHQLWVMRAGAAPRSLGLLDGETPVVAKDLSTRAKSLAVTVERDGGSARPTSKPLVQLTLESVGFGE